MSEIGPGEAAASSSGGRPGPSDEQLHTTFLANHAGTTKAAAERLLARVYDRLHRQASAAAAGDRAGRAIGATDLVHRAYERLYLGRGGSRTDRWASSGQFRAAFARTMQCVLIDHARSELRQRRHTGRPIVPLDGLDVVRLYTGDPGLVLDVHQAFRKLARQYPKCHPVAVQRVYGGLSVAEVAALLRIEYKTAQRRWNLARSALQESLAGQEG